MFFKKFTDKIQFVKFFSQFNIRNNQIRGEKATALRKLKQIIKGIQRKSDFSHIYCLKADHLLSVYFTRWRNISVNETDSASFRTKFLKYYFGLFRADLLKKRTGERMLNIRKNNFRVLFINKLKEQLKLKRKITNCQQEYLKTINYQVFFKKCMEHIKLHPRLVFVVS